MLDVRVCNIGSKAHFTLTEINESYGSLTLQETDSGTDSDSGPIPVVGS